MYRKNVAGQFLHLQGVDATTGGIKSGVTWTQRRCIDGTFAAGGATITEDGTTGWYKCALSQADTNGNDIGFNFTGTSCVPQTINIITTGADPTDATNFGLAKITSLIASTTALTESYAALHAAPSQAQLLFEIRAMLVEKSTAGTTLTCKKIDGSTTAATFTLGDATNPTSITRAS